MGTDESNGRRSLSATLHRLRSALPVWPLVVQADTVGWDAAAGAHIDTVRFGECIATAGDRRSPEAESPHAAGTDTEAAQALAEAVSLWRGPFLDGFHLRDSEAYEEWLQRERKRWEDRVIEALAQLVELEAAAGSWASLVDHARQALGPEIAVFRQRQIVPPTRRELRRRFERGRRRGSDRHPHCRRGSQEERQQDETY